MAELFAIFLVSILMILGGCSLAPGQLDAIKATNSCVMISTQGSPAGGTATTTLQLPKPPVGGLGLLADGSTATAPTSTQTCTVTVTDRHDGRGTP